MWYYDGYKQNPTPPAWLLAGILAVVSFVGLLTAIVFTDIFSYLDWLYLLSSVKVVITILKFLPQVLLNIRRKSTKGWNIHGCWMDLIGAVLSILQFFLDCWDMNDWKGVAGNFVKLCLGVVSGSYDIIFITQHYILYPHSGDNSDKDAPVSSSVKRSDGENHGKRGEKAGTIALGLYAEVEAQDEEELLAADDEDNVFCDEEMDEFNDIVVVTTVAAANLMNNNSNSSGENGHSSY
jgi:hypothetical protein